MSGPTGVFGLQGLKGVTGPTGTRGITGMVGLQGEPGAVGMSGRTGLQGATGIQLYGNDSLFQTLTTLNPIFSSTSGTVVSFAAANPAMTILGGLTGPTISGPSSTISGKYGDTGLNAYDDALSVTQDGGLITFPPGKYFISALLGTSPYIMANEFYTFLVLSSYDGSSYTDIVSGIPVQAGSQTHLQHYFTPTENTVVSFRAVSSSNSEILFLSGTSAPSVMVSIVKIW